MTDAAIRANLRRRSRNTTVILISHRITTLMHADAILVLDRGRVAETGTHDELLARGGIYRRIYDLQTSGIREGTIDAPRTPDPRDDADPLARDGGLPHAEESKGGAQ